MRVAAPPRVARTLRHHIRLLEELQRLAEAVAVQGQVGQVAGDVRCPVEHVLLEGELERRFAQHQRLVGPAAAVGNHRAAFPSRHQRLGDALGLGDLQAPVEQVGHALQPARKLTLSSQTHEEHGHVGVRWVIGDRRVGMFQPLERLGRPAGPRRHHRPGCRDPRRRVRVAQFLIQGDGAGQRLTRLLQVIGPQTRGPSGLRGQIGLLTAVVRELHRLLEIALRLARCTQRIGVLAGGHQG